MSPVVFLTIWGGTALNRASADCEIVLRHSQFQSDAAGICNDGAVVARSIGVMNNCYISELNVSISASLNNKTIQCSSQDDSISIRTINTSTITLASSKCISGMKIMQ